MISIYQRALGEDFQRLHPKIQQRFGFSSTDGVASIGRGVMEDIWRGRFYTLPFLYIGTWRRIMFPERGQNIAFAIHNYAYVDSFGRETVTWVRQFETSTPRRFDATMVYSEQRQCIVDYLGSHQHLAVDIHPTVGEGGSLCIRSGEQRFYEGMIGFRFPMIASGYAEVCEWYDDDREQFGIEVRVTNNTWGPLFGYRGRFDVEWLECNSDDVPVEIKPVREERRE
ncbi:MAG: DUF4166 domain-containing protein [Phycisphaeraceae bacterium]